MFQIANLENMQPTDREELERAQMLAGKLNQRLVTRGAELKRFDDYYEGRHRLAFATSKFREAFGKMFSEFADNWCELVVDAVDERLDVEGFRVGNASEGDEDAWRIWQANDMDAMSQTCHIEALIHGLAYVMVGPGADGLPRITVEHPTETIVGWEPGNPRNVHAAFKTYTDDLMGVRRATLWTAEKVHRFETKQADRNTQTDAVEWTHVTSDRLEHGVPFVPYINKFRLLKEGRSEIATVIPVQDAINKLVTDMMVAAEFDAMPQRYATGIEIPEDENGKPMEPFSESAIKRFFYTEDANVSLGQFQAGDLGNLVKGIETLIQHVASQSRTPPHYFYLAGQFPSGESIKSAEAGLVAKVKRKTRHFGESHEAVMRLAGRYAGVEKLTDLSSEVIWKDPEYRTEGEHIDATLKKAALGVPQEQLWEDMGYTPQQRARFRTMAASERLLAPDPVEPEPEPVEA